MREVSQLHSAPDHIKETLRFLVQELDRKQGMIDDLHKIANEQFGMSHEDCDLLQQCVTDRDNLKAATDAMAAYFY